MAQKFSKFTSLIYRILASTRFFVFSIGLFVVHTVWLALSAASLPFDEYYHLGIIKYYSHQWSPFISHQPASVSYLGDITRLPSYLYHYLMSFPYRLLAHFIGSQYWLVVSLRLMNIAMVIGGVVLFRYLLLKLGVSRRVTHLALFVFMLLPIISLLAAESNYDNLMFLLTPIFFIFALNLVRGLISPKNLVGFISVGLLACLVKNEFLVVLGLTSIGVIYKVLAHVGFPKSWQYFKKSLKHTKRLRLVFLGLLLVISLGLFGERYGYNFVKYHSVNVPCQDVQSIEVCKNYSPWARNYRTKNNKSVDKLYGNPASFTMHWVATMFRGVFANFANVPSRALPVDPYGNYEFMPLLLLMAVTGAVMLIATIVTTIFYWRSWWSIAWLKAVFLVCVAYGAVLWLFNYRGYLSLGTAYAIQPRYLLPLLILMFAGGIEVVKLAVKSRQIRAYAALLIIIVFIYSGGAFGWFIRANSGWYWPSNTVINTNQNIQKVLKKVIANQL